MFIFSSAALTSPSADEGSGALYQQRSQTFVWIKLRHNKAYASISLSHSSKSNCILKLRSVKKDGDSERLFSSVLEITCWNNIVRMTIMKRRHKNAFSILQRSLQRADPDHQLPLTVTSSWSSLILPSSTLLQVWLVVIFEICWFVGMFGGIRIDVGKSWCGDTKVVGSVRHPLGQVSLAKTLNHKVPPEAWLVCTYWIYFGVISSLVSESQPCRRLQTSVHLPQTYH